MSLSSTKMASQVITLELPDNLYRTVNKLAQVPSDRWPKSSKKVWYTPSHHLTTCRPMKPMSLPRCLPWMTLPCGKRAKSRCLNLSKKNYVPFLIARMLAQLTPDNAARLQDLMNAYGRLLVRQSHASLLLARRGYQVPIQQRKSSFS